MALDMISGNEVQNKVKDGIHLVNVFGTWCGPCKMFAPILEDVSSEFEVHKIDIDENRDFATEMRVQGVPTTFIYKDGELKDQIVGFVPKDILVDRINKV